MTEFYRVPGTIQAEPTGKCGNCGRLFGEINENQADDFVRIVCSECGKINELSLLAYKSVIKNKENSQ